MQCDKASRTVTLVRMLPAVSASTGGALTITTDQGTNAVSTRPSAAGAAARLAATTPLLDSMAFTRGRFAVAMPGQPTLYLPSWTEISRVIEDCR